MEMSISYPLECLCLFQRTLASLLVTLGSVKSALEIYERLEMWEEVTHCLVAVGRRGRAEEVVRGCLAQRATPTLWCLLGDVTQVSGRSAWTSVQPFFFFENFVVKCF